MSKRRNWSLISIPDHEGVSNSGGRVGAALGPRAFRQAFDALIGRESLHETLSQSQVVTGLHNDVAQNHQQAIQSIEKLHNTTGLSLVIGGGHDHGYSQLAGIAKTKKYKRLGCLNIDAHLDLRKSEPKILSGSPFYLAIESGVLHPSRFIEFGIQRHCNGNDLWKYAKEKKIHIEPFENLRNGKAVKIFKTLLKKLAQKTDGIVLSFDLDAVAESFAPGVSAPQAEGFSSSEILELMEIAGQEKKVMSLGIFELNPEHDIQNRTARLAATCAFHFLSEKLRSK